MLGADERDGVREALCAAIAAEHTLCQTAAAEQAAARRWDDRARLAQRREAAELLHAARTRAAEHARRARAYQVQARREHARIAALKLALRPAARARPMLDHPPAHTLDRRLAALERSARLERDLAELKSRLARGVDAPGP